MDGKLVRDPIHNYINITLIEQSIIDAKEFQRLRFVFQNSTAYLTYPSNTNTRFLHSLGAMHLCGQFFSRALENSDAETLKKLLKGAEFVIAKQSNLLILDRNLLVSEWESSLGNACHFSHHPFHGERLGEANDANNLFLMNTLWQAVRIAGLCHDIGHFPMSHLFETVHEQHEGNNSTAAKEAKNRKDSYLKMLAADLKAESARRMKNIPLHELRGLVLFNEVAKPTNSYTRLVHSIARSVLTYDPDYNKGDDNETDLYRCLHRLVAGELDADRLDYCMRDPQQSGFEHDAIDVQRIINNFVLCEKDGRFKILPTDKALSAIETFFHHRFFVYKYVIYHHNVSRFNGVLEEILLSLFSISDETSAEYTPILEIMDRFKFSCKKRAEEGGEQPPQQRYLPDKYSHIYEDAWLRTLLTEIHTCLNEAPPPLDDRHKLIEIKSLIHVFLYRQTEDISSAWKRETDFHYSYKKISSILKIDASVIKRIHPFVVGDPGTKDILDACFKNLKRELKAIGVVLITSQSAHKIFSFKKHKQLELLCGDSLCSAVDASPYISSLRSVAEKTPGLHVSFVSKGIKRNEKLLEQCDELLHKNLAAYIEKLFKMSDDPFCFYALPENNRRINDIKVSDERRVGIERCAA